MNLLHLVTVFSKTAISRAPRKNQGEFKHLQLFLDMPKIVLNVVIVR
jgi:hypothetical protein